MPPSTGHFGVKRRGDGTDEPGVGVSSEVTRSADVARAIRALLRAERTLRTYPADNDLSRGALRDLAAQLVPALPVDLDVRADRFLSQGEIVVESDADRTDLPQRLYRDGVRVVRLGTGLEPEELERLIIAIATPIHPDDLSEDYVTRIWEAELAHVRVAAIDPYIDPDLPEDVLEGKERPEESLVELTGLEANEDDLHVPPPPEDAFHLTAVEQETVREQIEAAAGEPPWERFTRALLDVLGDSETAEYAGQVVELLETTFQRAIDCGDVAIGALVLEGLQNHEVEVAQRSIRLALDRLAKPERLIGLHGAIEGRGEEAELIRNLWLKIGPAAGPVLCSFLQRSGSRRIQRFYVETLVALGEPALAPAAQELGRAAPDIRVLCAQVLGGLRDPRAVGPLIGVLDAPEVGVRREAVRALGRIGGDRALERLLEIALLDTDASTRIVALRGLGSARSLLDGVEILNRIRSSGFTELADEEKDLLYRALGAAGGGTQGVVAFLRKGIEKSWLRARGTPRTWTRAASALALIASPDALEALERGSRSRHRELAEICRSSLEDARSADGEEGS